MYFPDYLDESSSDSDNTATIVGVVLGIFLLGLIITAVVCYYKIA